MSADWLLAFGILSSSFLGSWHCAGMCGPVASLMATRNSLISYHLGRMCTYVLLGGLAGYFGQFFLTNEFVVLRWISVVSFGLILILSGLKNILPAGTFPKLTSPSWSHFAFPLLRNFKLFRQGHSGLAVGMLTALLPCGWLYTYVAAAVASRSYQAGMLVLFIFWLGGLPALSALPFLVRNTIHAAAPRQQKIAGGLLVGAGLYSILSFFFLH